MDKKELENFKKKIEGEIVLVEKELKTVGRINPENPSDWEPVPQKRNLETADSSEVAESLDAFEDNTAILKQLEIRYNELKAAKERIAKGAFGLCVVDGEPIEKARLEANPAATTCVKHTKD